MKSTDKLKKVRALLGLEVKLEERKLENGTRFEADSFEAGKEVFIVTDEEERIAAPAGEYLLDDGMMLVVEEDGIIAEMKESVEEEVSETVEAPVVEELDMAEVADIEDWRGLEIRVKNLEDAIADLKADKENKVEASEIEVEAEVELSAEETAKPFKHNPEAKAKTETNLFAQNRAMTTKDRVFNKLFNNN